MSVLGNHTMVWPGSFRGLAWEFTEERWAGSLLMIEPENNRVMCWNLHARVEGQGCFRALRAAIEADGFRVAVPRPMPHMIEILKHYGFEMHVEKDPKDKPVDVWELPVAPSAA